MPGVQRARDYPSLDESTRLQDMQVHDTGTRRATLQMYKRARVLPP